MKKSLTLHPFLFAIAPILFLFSYNVGEVSFSDIVVPSLVSLGAALVLLVLSGLILKDFVKAGVFVSLALILFYSYGHVYGIISDWRIAGFALGKNKYLFPLWGIIFIFGTYLIYRTKFTLRNLASLLNVMAVASVVISLFNVGVYSLGTGTVSQVKTGDERVETAADRTAAVSFDGDIYYIILDGYANAATLQREFNFDDQTFIDYLTQKGFYVASESRSNYALTFLSLASSLNMKFVNYLAEGVGGNSLDRKAAYDLITDNEVMKSLKSHGYKFVHFSSGWGPTDKNRNADVSFKSGAGNEFLMILIQTTILRPLEKYLVGDFARKKILGAFEGLAEVSKIEGKKFVFAHINCPHPPYLFGANGEATSGALLAMSGDVWAQTQNYVNQVMFVNGKVEKMVDEILANSQVAPIIILQGDHGSASLFSINKELGWEHPDEAMLEERMRIFNAYYFPNGGDSVLYPGITPVNTFRLVFNKYFNTDFELLDDISYYSSYEEPYVLKDVTAEVR